ncbi:MAG: hypothetical protein AB9866_03335 [Syntrophobacteraceae bacterium]
MAHLAQRGHQLLVLTLDRRISSHGLKETIVPVIVQMGPQQSRLIPILHRGMGDAKLFGKLRHGKHTTTSKAVIASNKAVGFLDMTDTQPTERLAIDRTHSLMGQNGCDLSMCVIVKQPVNFGY